MFFKITFLTLLSSQVMAWENHALLTKRVLDDWMVNDSSISGYLTQTVKPESLKSFLNATNTKLPAIMQDIEHWARQNEKGYQSLPDHLMYQPTQPACAKQLETCFKKALRMNLDVPFNPIIYDASSHYAKQRGFKRITDLSKLMPAYIASTYSTKDFTAIPIHGKVRIADLIATGSIQPDFGFDTFLYENSQTSFGKLYGFGPQPIGNPALPFNSQMLFHMSAYHEDTKILAVISRLNETYPEYRAYLYFSLSRFAAENNHPYWAALFLGWGLHYIQDMTQPYHRKIAYGLDTNAVLQAIMEVSKNNALPFSELETIQMNRHIILENLTHYMLESSVDNGLYQKILHRSLIARSADTHIPPCDWHTLYVRNQVNVYMENHTPDYQLMLQATIPSTYINQPTFHVDSTMDYHKLFLQEMNKSQRLRFSQAVAQSLHGYGAFTRSCISGIAQG